MRVIEVKSCKVCWNRDHKGAFGNPSYIPVCRKTGKELPYETHPDGRGGLYAQVTGEIPEWCPLTKVEDLCEPLREGLREIARAGYQANEWPATRAKEALKQWMVELEEEG